MQTKNFVKIPVDILQNPGMKRLTKEKRAKAVGLYVVVLLVMFQYRDTGISVEALHNMIFTYCSQRDYMDLLQCQELFTLVDTDEGKMVRLVDLSHTRADSGVDPCVGSGVDPGVDPGVKIKRQTDRKEIKRKFVNGTDIGTNNETDINTGTNIGTNNDNDTNYDTDYDTDINTRLERFILGFQD